MNKAESKTRISMFIDVELLRFYKDFARRHDYPYQRLMQEALKYAIRGYLPKWEIPRQLLAGIAMDDGGKNGRRRKQPKDADDW